MRRLLIYAHFDAQARVRPFVVRHLRALSELGEVRFSSNSPLPACEVAKVRPLAAGVLLRENRGFDFGQWSEVLGGLALDSWEEIVLTNSSVVGPFFPLEPIFERMGAGPCDFWGMTACPTILPHIQSYFLVFKRRLLQSPSFREFFETAPQYRSKAMAILAGEVGLSHFLREQGFSSEAAFPRQRLHQGWWQNWVVRRRVGPRVRRSMDTTLYYPDLLLEAGMPFVKISLLEQNPAKLNLAPVFRRLAGHGFSLEDLR